MTPNCFVSKNLKDSEREKIRLSVCHNLLANLEYDGQYYCILHLPTKNKDEKLFEEVFLNKLNSIKQKLRETESLSEDIRERVKSNLILDFRYVWFPSIIDRLLYDFETTTLFGNSVFCEEVSFWGNFDKTVSFKDVTFCKEIQFNSKFLSDSSFNSAIFTTKAVFAGVEFSEHVSFDKAKFLNQGQFKVYDTANFMNTKFLKGAGFGDVLFESQVDFNSALFEDLAYFRGAEFYNKVSFFLTNFNGYTSFHSTKFFKEAKEVSFNSAKFLGNVEFNNAKFYFTGKANFENLKFERKVFFDEVKFYGEVSFNSSFLGKDSDVFFRRTFFDKEVNFSQCAAEGYLRFSDLIQGDENSFNFTKSSFEKATLVSFYNTRLQPSYFINCDTRDFSFVDVKWQYFDKISSLNVIKELKFLYKFVEGNTRELLKITCRQLAENAETNNRFEEASKLRQMAFECETLERKEKIRKWFQEPISCSSLFGKIGEKAKTFPYDFVHWLYCWSSGYGENRLWAFFILTLIIIISAILYATPLCEFPNGQNGVRSLDIIESIAYSLRVMVLQRPEPFPINNFGKVVLALESVFAPLQLALLALAIRRKFMR